MADLGRRAAFAAAAAVVTAALVALALAGTKPPHDGRAGSERPAPTVSGGSSPAAARGRERALRLARKRAAARRAASEDRPRRRGRRADIPGRREARTVAHSFVAALLRFEFGQIDDGTRRDLRRSATPRLAELVLSAPPRVPQGAALPPRGRVVAIEPVQGDGDRGELVATVERGRRRTGLLLELLHTQGRWRVAGLR